MPELPEVETIKRYVESALKGAQIQNVQVRQPKFREPVPDDCAQKITGAEIVDLKRIAKYMLMNLNNGLTIIWHFGMSGKIRIESADTSPELQKHDHIIIDTTRGRLIFNDPRRFGLVVLCHTNRLKSHHLLQHLGLDPWDKNLTEDYLAQNPANPVTVHVTVKEGEEPAERIYSCLSDSVQELRCLHGLIVLNIADKETLEKIRLCSYKTDSLGEDYHLLQGSCRSFNIRYSSGSLSFNKAQFLDYLNDGEEE